MSAIALGGAAPLGPSCLVHHFTDGPTSVLNSSAGGGGTDPLNSTFRQLLDALQSVNGEQVALDGAAREMQANGGQVTPSEMIMLSMRCDEFLFHCELTSNAANRGSDGLQESFREQSRP